MSRILIEAHHPAHIHFFKNAVRLWRERGDQVLLLGRDRDVMRSLLSAYDWIPHEIVSSTGRSNRFPLREMLARQAAVARAIRRFQPSVVLSLMGSYTQAARLLGVPNVIFTDSEFQSFNHRIAHPFATRIFTPRCFYKALGPKQVRYDGYHELAFLHPHHFTPRQDVLAQLRPNRREKNGSAATAVSERVEKGGYVVFRTSAWNTLHDIGESGLGPALDELIDAALGMCSVYIVAEGGRISPRWQDLRLTVPPDRYHDVLAFARLVVTEGASTASEAACLGVPSVYVSTTRRGYLEDQQRRYGLVESHSGHVPARAAVLKLLSSPPEAEALSAARARLIADHVDGACRRYSRRYNCYR
jgi:predicted glycosyltransferase